MALAKGLLVQRSPNPAITHPLRATFAYQCGPKRRIAEKHGAVIQGPVAAVDKVGQASGRQPFCSCAFLELWGCSCYAQRGCSSNGN
jgi:hypothetical protein